MVDNNVLSFAVLAAIALGFIYLMGGQKGMGSLGATAEAVASNEGSMTYAPQLAESTPAISSGCQPMAELPMGKRLCHEQVENVASAQCPATTACGPSCDYRLMNNNTNILPYPQVSNNYAPQVAVNQQFSNTAPLANGCFGRETLTSAELLPREDGHNVWQVVNPQAQGHLTDQNFLESGHHFGINTVGQSLKNANLQLRSDPVIPKRDIGPFLQSSYEPDTNRRFFEIGQC